MRYASAQQQAGNHEAHTGKQRGRQIMHADANRQIGGTPYQVQC
ncbi:MAG: hypothetical protein O2845_06925 [Proteobacteria bacterium]|nr:hypothetical protein [Pseudomonadota bacterium]